MPLHIVILAAGKGTRMKSDWPKVLHRVGGLPMIEYVLRTAESLCPTTITLVVGHKAEAVRGALKERSSLTFVDQEPQLGTAHAVMCTEPVLRNQQGSVVVLSGDVPLLQAKTLRELLDRHAAAHAAATVLTAIVSNPKGYGRIVRLGQRIARIVEEKDASPAERDIREINSGIYAFDLSGLYDRLKQIAAQNAQGEYYLPDLVDIYCREDRPVETLTAASPDDIRGINSRFELAEASRIVRQKKNAELMAAGVTIEDPGTTFVDPDVQIGADTVIHPCVSIEGKTTIGAGCDIHMGARIVNSQIGDRVTVLNHSVITDSAIDRDVSLGPFAHLRNGVSVQAGAKVGNFVEMKKTALGAGSKAMHLAYLGDAVIGSNVNIGAGTITCNYDGVRKHTTTIEDGAFIGSDTQLIAPVTVGTGAYVGTGTTIREDVPSGALAVSAGKQRNIEGWVEKKKQSRD